MFQGVSKIVNSSFQISNLSVGHCYYRLSDLTFFMKWKVLVFPGTRAEGWVTCGIGDLECFSPSCPAWNYGYGLDNDVT